NNHIVKSIVGQLNINLINNDCFDYTLQMRLPFVKKREIVKWMGIQQIIAVKGTGTVCIRVLEIPKTAIINNFCSGVRYETIESRDLIEGDFIATENAHQIIEIMSVRGKVLLMSLSVKDREAPIFWSFDKDSKSFLAESSTLLMSRLTNIFNFAKLSQQKIPSILYDVIFSKGDRYLKIKAIHQMLSEKNEMAFNHIQESIDSTDIGLSQNAQSLLNKLTGSFQKMS
ncbi:MAG TPA: hypothetical protein VK787_09565, partial [Puia sp.]|nr:hypothetical protein [Puia sp.]